MSTNPNSARTPMRSIAESRMGQEGQANAGGLMRKYDNGDVYYDSAPLTEYPRMLYRKTDVEQVQEMVESIAELKDPPMVINRFDGKLCETCIANDADDAERLATEGWDISPAAAYGEKTGLGQIASAKDARIAELEAMLAAQNEGATQKRGPGRPRREEPQDNSEDL